MSIILEGYDTNAASFAVSGDLEAGDPVVISAANTVSAADEDDDIIGVCLHTRNGLATVATRGFVKLSYSGLTAPTLGLCGLVADGDGGVVPSEDALRLFVVTEVNTTAKTVGFIL